MRVSTVSAQPFFGGWRALARFVCLCAGMFVLCGAGVGKDLASVFTCSVRGSWLGGFALFVWLKIDVE